MIDKLFLNLDKSQSREYDDINLINIQNPPKNYLQNNVVNLSYSLKNIIIILRLLNVLIRIFNEGKLTKILDY